MRISKGLNSLVVANECTDQALLRNTHVEIGRTQLKCQGPLQVRVQRCSLIPNRYTCHMFWEDNGEALRFDGEGGKARKFYSCPVVKFDFFSDRRQV